MLDDEQQSVEMYCDEYVSSRAAGDDPGEFGLDNYNNWLDSQGEPNFAGTEAEFLELVHAVDFNTNRLHWNSR